MAFLSDFGSATAGAAPRRARSLALVPSLDSRGRSITARRGPTTWATPMVASLHVVSPMGWDSGWRRIRRALRRPRVSPASRRCSGFRSSSLPAVRRASRCSAGCSSSRLTAGRTVMVVCSSSLMPVPVVERPVVAVRPVGVQLVAVRPVERRRRRAGRRERAAGGEAGGGAGGAGGGGGRWEWRAEIDLVAAWRPCACSRSEAVAAAPFPKSTAVVAPPGSQGRFAGGDGQTHCRRRRGGGQGSGQRG